MTRYSTAGPVGTLLFTLNCGFLEPVQKPKPTNGRPYDDTVLLQLLRSDRSFETDRLWIDSRGYVEYEAHLAETPPSDYLESYEGLIRSRGVLVRAISSSPHAIPPRIIGYSTLVIRPNRREPFTLSYATFSTRDDEWLKTHSFFNAPKPLHVEKNLLTLYLGRVSEPWRERVVVPTEDVEKLRELPSRRYPGAVLAHTWHPDDDELLNKREVSREYMVRGKGIGTIVVHYKGELEKLGMRVEHASRGTVSSLFWTGPSVRDIGQVSVSEDALNLIPGSGLGLDDLRGVLPEFFDALPLDLTVYGVHVWFTSPGARLPYLASADQERWKALRPRTHQ